MNWKDKKLYDRIFDRWTEMDSRYSIVNRNRELIVNYFRCDELLDIDDQGQLQGDEVYNASGMWYSQLMARGFQGMLVSKNIAWIEYLLDHYELQGVDFLDEWLQEVRAFMVDDYQRSNFYDVQPQFTLDGLTTGSPVMVGEEDILNRRTMWTPIHYKNVRVYYNKWNEPEGIIVKDPQWTAKQLYDTFIQRDDDSGTRRKAILPNLVNTALEQGRLQQEFTVYRAIFKANDKIWEGWKKPANWPWLDVYFCELTGVDDQKKDKPLNANMGRFTQPFVVWDYDKKPWEISSRTPAWYSIWDNLGLQDQDRALRENAQLKNRPPRYALAEMEGRLNLDSEDVTYVEPEEYDRPPRALDLIGDIRINEAMVQLSEGKIRRWFMADLFNKFSDLIRTNKQPVSAAQIWQMVGENATQLSPAIESHSRYMKDSDARHVDIASRRGEYPFDRWTMEEVFFHVVQNSRRRIGNISIVPNFIGQLAQAQKQSQELEPIRAGVSMIVESGITALAPETKYCIKGYETVDKMMQAVNFPQNCVRPKEEVDKMFLQEQQAVAQQQAFENAVEMAKAAKPASDAASMLMGGQNAG